MKIAICFAGEPRFYKKGAEHMQSFYRGCEIDYYIHSWATPESIDETYKELNDFFLPKKLSVQPYINFDTFFSINEIRNLSPNLSNAVSFLRSNFQVGKLLEDENTTEYDYVIFSRTDIAADGCLLNVLDEKGNRQKIYTSYVNGDDWIVDANNNKKDNCLDTKFVCSTKENMLHFSKLYENLFEYVIKENRPLCHHRLYYYHMKQIIKEHGHELLIPNKEHIIGGWYWIRKGEFRNN